MGHICDVGFIYDYDDTDLINFDQLLVYLVREGINYNPITHKFKRDLGFSITKYIDFRHGSNFTHFDYCPYCGSKIDWDENKNKIRSMYDLMVENKISDLNREDAEF